jgi:coenzyme F420-reducing hydrogenase delta subunit
MTTFEPRILALCCHYCAYAAADLAGSMRIQYPPDVVPSVMDIELQRRVEDYAAD